MSVNNVSFGRGGYVKPRILPPEKLIALITPLNFDDLQKAIYITKHVFQNKENKLGGPFVDHCIRVAESVKEHYRDPDLTAAAYMHDVIEDTDWTLDHLKEAGFNTRIINAVDSVTKRENKETGVEEPYFDFIERCAQNPDGIKIKIADINDNASLDRNRKTLTGKDLLRLNKYKIAKAYLESVLASDPNTASIHDFMSSDLRYNDLDILEKYGSSETMGNAKDELLDDPDCDQMCYAFNQAANDNDLSAYDLAYHVWSVHVLAAKTDFVTKDHLDEIEDIISRFAQDRLIHKWELDSYNEARHMFFHLKSDYDRQIQKISLNEFLEKDPNFVCDQPAVMTEQKSSSIVISEFRPRVLRRALG